MAEMEMGGDRDGGDGHGTNSVSKLSCMTNTTLMNIRFNIRNAMDILFRKSRRSAVSFSSCIISFTSG